MAVTRFAAASLPDYGARGGAVIKAKDFVTLGNLLCGAACIVFCIERNLIYAAWALLVAYGFDALDGPVARWTGGGNRFGAELDNLADYVTFGVAPSFVIYAAYRDVWPWVGIALGATLIVASTLRHVRNLVFEAPTTLCWVGLPRPAAGLLIVAFVHSRLFALETGRWLGVPLMLAVAWALLATFPTVNHRGRNLQSWVRAIVLAWLACWALVLLLAPAWFWDNVLAWVIAYVAFSWVVLQPAERRSYRETLSAWKKQISA